MSTAAFASSRGRFTDAAGIDSGRHTSAPPSCFVWIASMSRGEERRVEQDRSEGVRLTSVAFISGKRRKVLRGSHCRDEQADVTESFAELLLNCWNQLGRCSCSVRCTVRAKECRLCTLLLLRGTKGGRDEDELRSRAVPL